MSSLHAKSVPGTAACLLGKGTSASSCLPAMSQAFPSCHVSASLLPFRASLASHATAVSCHHKPRLPAAATAACKPVTGQRPCARPSPPRLPCCCLAASAPTRPLPKSPELRPPPLLKCLSCHNKFSPSLPSPPAASHSMAASFHAAAKGKRPASSRGFAPAFKAGSSSLPHFSRQPPIFPFCRRHFTASAVCLSLSIQVRLAAFLFGALSFLSSPHAFRVYTEQLCLPLLPGESGQACCLFLPS